MNAAMRYDEFDKYPDGCHESTHSVCNDQGTNSEPFFDDIATHADTAHLKDIDSIDFSPIAFSTVGSTEFEIAPRIAFVVHEATGQRRIVKGYAKRYEEVMGVILQRIIDPDAKNTIDSELIDAYDRVEERFPRVIAILNHMREQSIVPREHMTTVNNFCLILFDEEFLQPRDKETS